MPGLTFRLILRLLRRPGTFAYGSYSGAGGMNGFTYESAPSTKQSSILHPSERYLWVEEIFRAGKIKVHGHAQAPTPPGFTDASFVDRPAAWHGRDDQFI